jgi:hypothetical protein
MVMGGAAMAAIGCLLPWISEVYTVDVEAPTVTHDIFSSASSAALPGVDGNVITALALVSVVLSLLIWLRRMARVAALIALLLATVAAVTVVGDYLDITGSIKTLGSTYFLIFQVGAGIYVTAFGVIIWAIGGGTALLDRRRQRRELLDVDALSSLGVSVGVERPDPKMKSGGGGGS